ncbi:hypothetical protein [Paucibacter soli]|uniref:hypothetical protein n=1 Tax=Paucibacter soli TaxID=3133433 RepID=UPI0030B01849
MARIALAPGAYDELEEALDYHDPQRAGFVSLMATGERGRMRQSSFKLIELPNQLHRMQQFGRDAFICQNEFFRPNRQAVNLWRMTANFIDLDTYRVEHLASRSPEDQRDMLLQYLDDEQLPPPSVVVFSGRGLQVKWYLTNPVPRRAAPRWQAVQDELCRRLTCFGADAQARDVSRVLRVTGTVNAKSGEIVRVLHRASIPTMGGSRTSRGAIAYDFDLLADELLPLSRQELKTLAETRELQAAEWEADRLKRAAVRDRLTVLEGGAADLGSRKAKTGKKLVASELAMDRLEDIRNLFELRGWSKTGAPAGKRDAVMFLVSCFLADSRLCQNIQPELQSLAREFAPSWSARELASATSAAIARAAAAERGEKVIFEGMEVCPRYRFRNETLVTLLEITSDEQRQLQTIVGVDEARRRDRDRKANKRREAGCPTREAYLARTGDRALQAREMKASGHTNAHIASVLGVSLRSVTTYCKN